MMHARLKTATLLSACALILASCGAVRNNPASEPSESLQQNKRMASAPRQYDPTQPGLFDAARMDKSEAIKVNRFLWTASLQVLDFLPVQSADPFTGVITTGFGTPPGGGTPYRATILISDPALEARSLNVALQTRGGPVSAATQRAVEDAILARARQLRVGAGRF